MVTTLRIGAGSARGLYREAKGALRAIAAVLAMTFLVVGSWHHAMASGFRGNAAGLNGALPAACASLLEQERCWLRSSGNDERSVELAIADARAVYERWELWQDTCTTAAQWDSRAFAESGCAAAADDGAPLPAAAQVSCPEGEFFFVRDDGRVSGCHTLCTVTADCTEGLTCSGTGSAAGGPVAERFCE